jgi:hypothetical protein
MSKLDQNHLGTFEVIADSNQQHALADDGWVDNRLRAASGRVLIDSASFLLMREASSEKGQDDKSGSGHGPGKSPSVPARSRQSGGQMTVRSIVEPRLNL